jgi:Holliday junction resolvasome RuvABC DNA-binding subunit|tara:strand:- start:50 stop:316 length:267 start_codon:yes stop_codon:yes gene_type:complete
MTNQQIEYLSQKIAELVIAALEDKQKQWDTELVQDLKDITESPEEKLLSDLAQAMTALDYNLKQENYSRCSQLQDEIKDIEKQLKNLK